LASSLVQGNRRWRQLLAFDYAILHIKLIVSYFN
jgi:hypothetical protein